jgi:hypothetical protein
MESKPGRSRHVPALDDEVLEILREIGVDFAQAYGIEKKRPIVELLAELS